MRRRDVRTSRGVVGMGGSKGRIGRVPPGSYIGSMKRTSRCPEHT
jgi:hypothetical protein